jgi:hypothetical protein
LRIGHSFPFQQRHSPPCRGSSAQISIIIFLVISFYGCDMPIEQVGCSVNGSRNPFYFFIVADLSLNRFQWDTSPLTFSNITKICEKSKYILDRNAKKSKKMQGQTKKTATQLGGCNMKICFVLKSGHSSSSGSWSRSCSLMKEWM